MITTVRSNRKSVSIGRDLPTAIIGERINPTGRKVMQAALLEGDFDMVRQDAIAQVAAGAAVLDVNAGIPGIDEADLLMRLVQEIGGVVDVPLCIDTADPEALKAALASYDGKALVNSVSGEEKSMRTILPLVGEHGAAVIALCMDDAGIPDTPEKRMAVAAKIIKFAAQYGIEKEDVVVDPLVLSMGADSNAGRMALETTRLISEELGVNMTMGASNISFGLPDRKGINAAFIAMAIHAGVTCPITNPLIAEITASILAADLAMGRDQYAMRWIKSFRKRNSAG
ncbi:MAG TPA: dihydropteroate synthase [candidate division Zixibacteria bacterium]|nr:dihydropteroate synthase [candidate division Zixibacteria bacterium]